MKNARILVPAALCSALLLCSCGSQAEKPLEPQQETPASARSMLKPDNTPPKLSTVGKEKPAPPTQEKATTPTCPALPFGVMLAGKTAVPHKEDFAIVAEPVPANADLSLDSKYDLVIINAYPSDESGKELSEKPIIILINKDSKTSLDKALDHKKFAPGMYIMSINANDKTAKLLFTVK